MEVRKELIFVNTPLRYKPKYPVTSTGTILDGTITPGENGEVIYTPPIGFIGKVDIYHACGEHGPLHVEVNIVPETVDIVDGNVKTQPLTPVIFKVSEEEIVDSEAIGEITLHKDKHIMYQPAEGFTGTDIVIFKLKSGEEVSVAVEVKLPVLEESSEEKEEPNPDQSAKSTHSVDDNTSAPNDEDSQSMGTQEPKAETDRKPGPPKQHHRLLINPKEFGLSQYVERQVKGDQKSITDRIKKALLDQHFADEARTKSIPSFFKRKKGRPKASRKRHRLLVNPEELGLTARIKTALLVEDRENIVTRICRLWNGVKQALGDYDGGFSTRVYKATNPVGATGDFSTDDLKEEMKSLYVKLAVQFGIPFISLAEVIIACIMVLVKHRELPFCGLTLGVYALAQAVSSGLLIICSILKMRQADRIVKLAKTRNLHDGSRPKVLFGFLNIVSKQLFWIMSLSFVATAWCLCYNLLWLPMTA